MRAPDQGIYLLSLAMSTSARADPACRRATYTSQSLPILEGGASVAVVPGSPRG